MNGPLAAISDTTYKVAASMAHAANSGIMMYETVGHADLDPVFGARGVASLAHPRPYDRATYSARDVLRVEPHSTEE